MRHEHEQSESQDATFLAGMPAGNMTAHERIKTPAAHGTGQRQETETGTIVALTQTLVTSLPPRSALLRALSLGPRLLPCMRALALYTLPDGTRGSLTLAGEVERHDDGTALEAHDVWQQRATLGHGDELDRHALDEQVSCRVGGIIAVPLVSPASGLVGVLVAEERVPAHARERHPLLDVLAHCLTVLLERHLRDEATGRRARALSTLSELAARAPEIGTGLDADIAARDAVLHTAAGALRELALPLASVALVPAPDGGLRLAGGPPDAPAQLDPARGAELLAALHGQMALTVSAGHTSGIWDDLAALREQVDQQAARITLLPVWIEDEAAGVLALAHAHDGLDERYWMPEATAIAIAAGAGIRALRLADAAAEEGRARDEFISLAAHELRSPLTSIKGFAQLLTRQARKTTMPDSMLRSVAAIEEQSLRMSEMVGELLDASRIRRNMLDVQLAMTDLVPLAQKVVEKRRAHYPRHTITLRYEEPLDGRWDVQRVEQILRDLLDNAARYSPEGGAIALEMTRVDGMAQVCVRDEGIGIAPDDQAHIFDYLYRAPMAEERNLSGLGLGLYICRHLAERMGGRLELHETHMGDEGEPHGSEFRLLLPLA